MKADHSNDALSEERVDLRALDPDLDPGAEERLVSAVMSRVARVGVRPSIPTDPLYGLWSLPRPLLIAASCIALVAIGAAVGALRPRDAAPATVAAATGVPRVFLATGATRP
jgi:hypothetical protein